jgi:hypothetical protein
VDAEDVDEPAPPGTLDEATGGTEVLDADAEVRIGDPTTVEDGSMTVELLDVYVEQGQIVVVEYTVLVTVRSLFWIFHSFAETPKPNPSRYAAVRRIFSDPIGTLRLSHSIEMQLEAVSIIRRQQKRKNMAICTYPQTFCTAYRQDCIVACLLMMARAYGIPQGCEACQTPRGRSIVPGPCRRISHVSSDRKQTCNSYQLASLDEQSFESE